MTRIAVNGVCGRMGRRVASIALEDPSSWTVTDALEAAGCPDLGKDVTRVLGVESPSVKITKEIEGDPQVLIDFTCPEGTMRRVDACASRAIAMVIGTTGLADAEVQALKRASGKTAILLAPNMSLGMNVLFRLVNEAAAILGEEYDIEIVEAHHRFKKDAPSGSALALAREAARGRGVDLDEKAIYGRKGVTGERPAGQIGIHAIRAGDVVGDHVVSFTTLGERIELTHRAHSRDTFARGALAAARALAEKPPGWYAMKDLLGLAD